MATAAQIRQALEKLGTDAAATGFDETRVSEDLDAGLTPNQIALAYWEKRAAATSYLVDVSESGSSRSLSNIHRASANMAERYQRLVEQDAALPGGEVPTAPTRGPGIRTFSIRRVAR